MDNFRYQSRVTSAISDESSQMSVKSHVSYQWWVRSAVRHESRQLWVASRQGRVITRQWRFDEQLQRKMAFKHLITWCFLKKHSNVKAWSILSKEKYWDVWSIKCIEGWKYTDFLTLRLIRGKIGTLEIQIAIIYSRTSIQYYFGKKSTKSSAYTDTILEPMWTSSHWWFFW